MNYRQFANTDIKLSSVGLGCMGMSYAYGTPDNAESKATLIESLRLGVNFWDTADLYGQGANELLLTEVLKETNANVFLATKIGFRVNNPVPGQFEPAETVVDGSPEYIRTAVNASLARLNGRTIDLLYLHRVDPKVPVEVSVAAMAEFVKAGKVRYLGLSECTKEDLLKAHAVWPISAVQSEYSLLTRGVEADILPLTKQLGIAFVPFAPIARGLLSNQLHPGTLPATDFRSKLPRYSGEHLENNEQLAREFAQFAAQLHATPAQLAIAWVLHQGDHIIPIPGTKRRTYLTENCGAAELVLTDEHVAKIDRIVARHPNIGPRYSPHLQAFIKK
jgi:aryl-alcohol dehydrogenase-like predicted oxidoreductase